MARDYREIQVSSSILVFIILGIIILGAVIFFIGVQVGKKQADLMLKTVVSQKTEEKVSVPEPVPPTEETSVPATATTQPAETKPEAKTQATTTAKTAEPSGSVISSTKTTSGQTETSATSKTPSPAPKPATPAPASSGNYFIQVGAFTDRASARLEVEKYKKQGYNAVVKEPFPKDRRPLYRVWLGSFKSRDEAQKVLNDLKSKSVRNPGFFIVQQ